MLAFYFLQEQNIFELLRSSGYSGRQIRGDFLYGDRNGGSSVHHGCQGADYFYKKHSLPFSLFSFFFSSSLLQANSGITIIY